MYWSAVLVLAMAGPTEGINEVAYAPAQETFHSYNDAWNAAQKAERPLLVILNPPAKTDADQGISETSIREDQQLKPLLDEYVVAVIDTGTDHGKTVHKLFDSAPLPRVVVIDKQQKYQIYRTSEKMSNDKLAKVLDQHKDGELAKPVLNWVQPSNSNCPSCQRRWTYSY